MKYSKKIALTSAGKHRRYNETPGPLRRMSNPLRTERLDLTTRVPFVRTREKSARFYCQVRRFFESRIGSSWDKVWSEFCEKCQDREHRRWALQYVVMSNEVEIRAGVVVLFHPRIANYAASFDRYGDLFVHPRTGQLCGPKSHARSQKKRMRTSKWMQK